MIAFISVIQAFQGPVTRGVPRRASLLLSEEPVRVRAAPPAPHVQSAADELRAILAEEEQAEADLAEADGVIGEATMRALGLEDGLNEYRALKEELRALGSDEFEAELALGEAVSKEFEAALPAMQELEQARLAAAEAEKARMQARGMAAGPSDGANKEAGLTEYRALKTALLTDTLIVGAAGTALLYQLYGADAALAFGGGSACGLLYIDLLQREIDGVGRVPLTLADGLAARLTHVVSGARLALPILLVAALSLQGEMTTHAGGVTAEPPPTTAAPLATAPPRSAPAWPRSVRTSASTPVLADPRCAALLSTFGEADGDLALARACLKGRVTAAASPDARTITPAAQVPLPRLASGLAGFFAWKLPLRRRAGEWAAMELGNSTTSYGDEA
eukprot:CAMPEP_0118817430 /NCGR_PEP_ID=MMETSP1162-20130426/5423_1 /TAXON_ID=33656 /ORGANISM="Phaeocystis Sp, Strain CCMP2710" /LENGTH=391 /DNA_ID=CAMNT_0006747533 /DNA_START=30 /DNA_END=1205 /DNA_ORIENTATION=-